MIHERPTTSSLRTPPQQTRHAGCVRRTFDPALTGLAWALATGAGRIPFLP
jgi:hypothetical protein